VQQPERETRFVKINNIWQCE